MLASPFLLYFGFVLVCCCVGCAIACITIEVAVLAVGLDWMAVLVYVGDSGGISWQVVDVVGVEEVWNDEGSRLLVVQG